MGSNIPIDMNSFDYKIVKDIYETYSKDLMMFDVDGNLSLKNRYIGLLKLLTSIRANFENIFEKTVKSTPGMKVWLLINTEVDDECFQRSDWFARYMDRYLVWEDEDEEFLKAMNPPMAETLLEDGVNPGVVKFFAENDYELLNPYGGEVILKFGTWNRDEDGRLVDPIYIKQVLVIPDKEASQIDVNKILDEQGILDVDTGEIIVIDG